MAIAFLNLKFNVSDTDPFWTAYYFIVKLDFLSNGLAVVLRFGA